MLKLGEFNELHDIAASHEIFSEEDFIVLLEAGEISSKLEKTWRDNGWDRLVDMYAAYTLL